MNRHPVENLLWNGSSYYQWYFKQTKEDEIFRQNDDLLIVYGFIEEATALVVRKELPRAMSLINRACTHIKSLLQAQPFLLIHRLFDAFNQRKWISILFIRTSLIRFIFGMAKVCLGEEHIISKMCKSLMDESVLDGAGLAFLNLLSDMGSLHMDPESSAWAICALRS